MVPLVSKDSEKYSTREKSIHLRHFSDIKTIQFNVWAMRTVGGAWRGELMELEVVEKQVQREKMDLNV